LTTTCLPEICGLEQNVKFIVQSGYEYQRLHAHGCLQNAMILWILSLVPRPSVHEGQGTRLVDSVHDATPTLQVWE